MNGRNIDAALRAADLARERERLVLAALERAQLRKWQRTHR